MFKIQFKSLKLENLNTRLEFAGEDRKPAADLALTGEFDPNVLEYFHRDLKGMLFKKYEAPEGDMFQEQEQELIEWRFVELKTIKWDYDGEGYRFVIWSDIGGTKGDGKPAGVPDECREDVVLVMSSVNKFTFKSKNNGSFEISFKVSGHPSPEQVGRLFELQGDSVSVTLEPPTLGE